MNKLVIILPLFLLTMCADAPVTPPAGALEVGSLFINDCAGNTQLVSCSGTTRSLENISIDGGTF